MSLGQNIMNKRKELKLSQEYIAEQLNVSRQAVSKWETGQSEPTAKNLVELAKVFNVTVSELIEPEKISQVNERAKKKQTRKSSEIFAIAAYTGAAIMSSIQTNDPYFRIFTSFLILISAIIMAINIARLPADIRFKMALKELLYCIVVYCAVTFLASKIGNVLSSIVVLTCYVIYVKYIRFQNDS